MTPNNQLQNQLQQQNPPVPPQAVALEIDPVPLAVRKLRVANGSRRQRDLAAVRMAGELEHLSNLRVVDVASLAPAFNRLWQAVPDSTWGIWLAPIRIAGVAGATLLLSAPDGIRTWLERRYTNLILEALEGTGYTEVEFVSAWEGG